MQSSRPAFKSSLSVTILPGEGVFLVGENEALTLYGPMMERLAALVQSGFSIGEILSATGRKIIKNGNFMATI